MFWVHFCSKCLFIEYFDEGIYFIGGGRVEEDNFLDLTGKMVLMAKNGEITSILSKPGVHVCKRWKTNWKKPAHLYFWVW